MMDVIGWRVRDRTTGEVLAEGDEDAVVWAAYLAASRHVDVRIEAIGYGGIVRKSSAIRVYDGGEA